LDLAQRSQTALNQEVESLRARLEEAMSTRAAEVESLSEDNARLAQMLVEYEAKEASLNSENASLHARLRDVEHLSHALSTAREQASQWQSAADQFELRCTALEEQLAQERAQHEAAACSAAAMQNELAVLQTSLQNTEAQLAELEAVQDAFAAQESRTEELERKLIATEAELEASRRSALLERNKSQESSQTGQGQSLPAGMDADDVAELMDELSALRSQLSASSEVASGKEEELRKYKLQLVKAKKLRALDAEKLAAAEAALKAATAQVQEQQHLAEPPNGTSPASEEDIALLKDRLAAAETEMAGMSALREELESLREMVGETEAGMNEALAALGVEEAKVARLAEMLNEHGVADDVLEAELDAVEELMMEMSGDGGGGSEEEESIL
jgi:DNA repair exonuclease SbcCD ATPase subunit